MSYVSLVLVNFNTDLAQMLFECSKEIKSLAKYYKVSARSPLHGAVVGMAFKKVSVEKLGFKLAKKRNSTACIPHAHIMHMTYH